MSRPKSLFIGLLVVVVISGITSRASNSLAGPAPPPGGHHPIFFGGDNTPGYPPLNTSGGSESKIPVANRNQVTISPNPFHGSTRFSFTTNPDDTGDLRIYSTGGRLVREFQTAAGVSSLVWDGRDASARRVQAGLYFFKFESGGRSTAGRLVILR